MGTYPSTKASVDGVGGKQRFIVHDGLLLFVDATTYLASQIADLRDETKESIRYANQSCSLRADLEGEVEIVHHGDLGTVKGRDLTSDPMVVEELVEKGLELRVRRLLGHGDLFCGNHVHSVLAGGVTITNRM